MAAALRPGLLPTRPVSRSASSTAVKIPETHKPRGHGQSSSLLTTVDSVAE